ncbi:Ubiquitinyl hydrolase 1 [Plasmodiophora brassicae]
MGLVDPNDASVYPPVPVDDADSDDLDVGMDNESEGVMTDGPFCDNGLQGGPHKRPRLENGELVGPVPSPTDSTLSENDELVENVWAIPAFSRISTDRIYSKPFAGGPPEVLWRTLLFPRGNHNSLGTHLSIYVELYHVPPDRAWRTLNVQFQFQMINQQYPDQPFLSEESTFVFTKPGADRGFDAFFPLSKLRSLDREWIANDQIEIRTVLKLLRTQSAGPGGVELHGGNINCRATCGFVGLKNQGATCYMNSLLQTLFHLGAFRRAVYQMPLDDAAVSVPLALQKVFASLQTSTESVCTKDLTASFGWQSVDSFMQHDVQEFSRVLCDNLETKMKKTPVEGAIAKLLEGKSEAYIQCINVDYKSTRVESFYDLSLNVKGLRGLRESFMQYIETETLEGANQYRAEGYGLQDAKKGVRFLSLPPVLFIHLKRFEYDPIHNTMVKLNDRFEFPIDLDLTEFMHDPAQEEHFVLYSVLVHSGSVFGGHYYAYVCPNAGAPDSKWIKFDDDFVSAVPTEAATVDHYGGDSPIDIRTHGRRGRDVRLKTANAYMLVYIRKRDIPNLMAEMKESDIPACIRERIERDEQVKREEEAAALEESRKLTITFFSAQQLQECNGIELSSFQAVPVKIFNDVTCETLVEEVEKAVGVPAAEQRWFVYSKRENKTVRANKPFDWQSMRHKSISEMFESLSLIHHQGPCKADIFVHDQRHSVRLSTNDMLDVTLPRDSSAFDTLLFFKYFDVSAQTLSFVGCRTVPPSTTIRSLASLCADLVSLPPDVDLDLYEEEDVKARRINLLQEDMTVAACKLIHGDIICFQQRQRVDAMNETQTVDELLSTVPEYLLALHYSCTVSCVPVTSRFSSEDAPMFPEFRLNMRNDWSIPRVISAIAHYVHVASPDRIRIYPRSYSERRENRTECYTVLDHESILDSLLRHCNDDTNPVFYEVLDFSVHDLCDRDVITVVWRHNSDSVVFPVLVPKKHATGAVLFDALKSRPDVMSATGGSVECIRLLAVGGSRALSEIRPPTLLEPIIEVSHGFANGSNLHVRAEITPMDTDDSAVVWISFVITGGYVPKYYGEPVGVVIPKNATLGQCFDMLCDRIEDTRPTPCKHRQDWAFACLRNGTAQLLKREDVIWGGDEQNPPALPDSDDIHYPVGRFLLIDQGGDGPKRQSRANPLDRPIKIYN